MQRLSLNVSLHKNWHNFDIFFVMVLLIFNFFFNNAVSFLDDVVELKASREWIIMLYHKYKQII